MTKISHLATLNCRKQNIPNLMGVKFTDEHIMDFVLCAELAGGKYNMLFGRHGMMLCNIVRDKRFYPISIATGMRYCYPH